MKKYKNKHSGGILINTMHYFVIILFISFTIPFVGLKFLLTVIPYLSIIQYVLISLFIFLVLPLSVFRVKRKLLSRVSNFIGQYSLFFIYLLSVFEYTGSFIGKIIFLPILPILNIISYLLRYRWLSAGWLLLSFSIGIVALFYDELIDRIWKNSEENSSVNLESE